MAAYNPGQSQVRDDALANFIMAPITGDITEIPGVGPTSAAALAAAGVETSYQLIGKYLSFMEFGGDREVEIQAFYEWLKGTGTASGSRAGVVHSIAEKLNVAFPGSYDPSWY